MFLGEIDEDRQSLKNERCNSLLFKFGIFSSFFWHKKKKLNYSFCTQWIFPLYITLPFL